MIPSAVQENAVVTMVNARQDVRTASMNVPMVFHAEKCATIAQRITNAELESTNAHTMSGKMHELSLGKSHMPALQLGPCSWWIFFVHVPHVSVLDYSDLFPPGRRRVSLVDPSDSFSLVHA